MANNNKGWFDRSRVGALPVSDKNISSALESYDSKNEKHILEYSKGRRIAGVRETYVAGAAYCLASLSMVLFNKMALSSFEFHSMSALLLFQCTFCVICSYIAALMGLAEVEGLSKDLVKVWLPVNILFVLMIGTGFLAIKNLNVGMLTVLKNLTNLITIGGDYIFYGRVYSVGVWICILLMLVSAFCGALTDLTFDARGYFWQIVNCFITASYSLSIRGAMDAVVEVTKKKRKLSEISMVFLNNLLSIPLILALMIADGEIYKVLDEPELRNPAFLSVAICTGFLGFFISVSSLWFLSTTTPTIYSLVGSLNKVPLAFLGLFVFSAPWSIQNLASIFVGLMAGVAFAIAKQKG